MRLKNDLQKQIRLNNFHNGNRIKLDLNLLPTWRIFKIFKRLVTNIFHKYKLDLKVRLKTTFIIIIIINLLAVN